MFLRGPSIVTVPSIYRSFQRQPVPNLLLRPSTSVFAQNRRYLATATKPLTVDQVLRKFYSISHPDRFTQDPAKRDINQKSFALLQNYLDFIKTKGRNQVDPIDAFTLQFHTTTNKTGSVIVVPPNPEDDPKKLGAHLYRTLTDLFDRCEFQYSPFDVSEYGTTPSMEFYANSPTDLTLVNFVLDTIAQNKPRSPANKQALKQKTAEGQIRVQFVKDLVAKLVQKYQLGSIEFKIQEHLFLSPGERATRRIAWLQRLEYIFGDMNTDGLKGLKIHFKKITQVEDDGEISLAYDYPEQWVDLLREHTPQAMYLLVERAKARIAMETQIQDSLGIASFKPEPALARSLVYRSLIGKIISRRFDKIPHVKKLKVIVKDCITPSMEAASCTLYLPLSATAQEVFEVISTNGRTIVDQASVVAFNVSEIQKTFRCTSITHDAPPDLSSDELSACIERLYKHQGLFLPYFAGLKFHIGNSYGYNPESDILSIRWDFMIPARK